MRLRHARLSPVCDSLFSRMLIRSLSSHWARATVGYFLERQVSSPLFSRSACRSAGCVSKPNTLLSAAVNSPTAQTRSSACVGSGSSLYYSQLSRRTTSSSSSSMSSPEMSQRMVWVDLEMTGLNIDEDEIIEMACIITDYDLNILAEGPNLIINQRDELLDGMSDWCKEHHGKSGLTQAVRDSKITLEQAEYEFLSFVRQHTPPGQCPLAGNSVHADKKFLDKYMPQFMCHLHYRIIDVSTIKELCRRWFPEEYTMAPQKKASHRALTDIRESIKELQFYRVNIFKASAEDKRRKHGETGDINTI